MKEHRTEAMFGLSALGGDGEKRKGVHDYVDALFKQDDESYLSSIIFRTVVNADV